VSAWEVEVVVTDHPDVAACAVIGVDDEISGEEVMAVVVPQPRVTIDPIALLDHCQDRLPYFAVPRYLRTVDALPMNTSQRVEKYKLRGDGVTPDTWDREAHGYELRR
jgi:crotonobetaine/carnitine-CoA ligase